MYIILKLYNDTSVSRKLDNLVIHLWEKKIRREKLRRKIRKKEIKKNKYKCQKEMRKREMISRKNLINDAKFSNSLIFIRMFSNERGESIYIIPSEG